MDKTWLIFSKIWREPEVLLQLICCKKNWPDNEKQQMKTNVTEQSFPECPMVFKPEEKLPAENYPVIVLCPSFRRLGYLQDGIWRTKFGDEEITDVIGWAI